MRQPVRPDMYWTGGNSTTEVGVAVGVVGSIANANGNGISEVVRCRNSDWFRGTVIGEEPLLFVFNRHVDLKVAVIGS